MTSGRISLVKEDKNIVFTLENITFEPLFNALGRGITLGFFSILIAFYINFMQLCHL